MFKSGLLSGSKIHVIIATIEKQAILLSASLERPVRQLNLAMG